MARTYDLVDLALNDVDSGDWALAYVRFALRDKPNDESAYPAGSLEDEEINAALSGAAIIDTGQTPSVTYYRPHRVAADLLLSNPTWVVRWSAAGVSEETRDPDVVAKAIVKAGAWIDTAIADDSDGRVSAGQLRLVT